jgi:hypothetical protein
VVSARTASLGETTGVAGHRYCHCRPVATQPRSRCPRRSRRGGGSCSVRPPSRPLCGNDGVLNGDPSGREHATVLTTHCRVALFVNRPGSDGGSATTATVPRRGSGPAPRASSICVATGLSGYRTGAMSAASATLARRSPFRAIPLTSRRTNEHLARRTVSSAGSSASSPLAKNSSTQISKGPAGASQVDKKIAGDGDQPSPHILATRLQPPNGVNASPMLTLWHSRYVLAPGST